MGNDRTDGWAGVVSSSVDMFVEDGSSPAEALLAAYIAALEAMR